MKGIKLLNVKLLHPITMPGVPGVRAGLHKKQVKSMEFVSTSMIQVIALNGTVCMIPVSNVAMCTVDDEQEQ